MRFTGVVAAGLQLSAAVASGASNGQIFLGDNHHNRPGHHHGGKRPNIVFVLTDDQDLHMDSLNYIPLIKKHLIDRGTLFKRHYCTTAICCPARVSLWTGKLAHNTNVTDVNPPHGGYPKFIKQGLNEAYLPVWLQRAGYDTYYTGKLFNAHTIENYNSPYPAGWNQSDFLLDPYTYMYLNATYQRNREPPKSYHGQHTVDVLREKALGFLEEAASHVDERPFFLGIAPVAPHSNVESKLFTVPPEDFDKIPEDEVVFTPPIPAERHAHLFADAKVPRTPNFNPEQPGGAAWIRHLPRLSDANVAFNDHFYRQRLRALQSVDELVDSVVTRLDELGLLDNTYIFYTTDNGYHISQHRLQPGKECGFEEDINIPLIIRGPGVPKGEVSEVVTTHSDLAPTILKLAGVDLGSDGGFEQFGFDGAAVPLNRHELEEAQTSRHEHVTVEFWGFAATEGNLFRDDETRIYLNNTYKAVRVISREYSFYYAVWCHNEHELYDLKTDPYQLNNLLHADAKPPTHLLGVPFEKVIARLDALLFVLKSCKGGTCTKPWAALHPQGNVQNLRDALSPRFDAFYEHEQEKVRYNRCELGYIPDAEGPQFETHGAVYRQGARWSEWV